MSLARKIIRGSAINVADHLIKIAVVFVTTPLMVRHLGEHDYGLWIVAGTIIGYLRLLDLGVSLTGNRFLGRAIGTGEIQEYRENFIALSYLFNRIGLFSLITTVALALGLPLLLPGNAGVSEARWILLGLGLSTSVRFWTQIFSVVLKSHLRYDWIGVTSITKTLIQGGLLVFLLTHGHGLFSLVLVYIATEILDQVLLALFARRAYPECRLLIVRGRPPGLPPILRYSGTAILASLGNQLRNGLDPLLVGHFSGLALVPVYSIGSRFLSLFTDLINAIFGGNLLAAFSQLDGSNDREGLVRNFLTSLRFSTAFATAGGGVLVLFGPDFIKFWIGPAFADSGRVLLILAAPVTLSLAQYPVGSLLYSQNKQHWLAFAGLGGGVFNAALSVILVVKIGFFGVVWGTFVELLLHFGLLVPLLAARACKLNAVSYLWRILKESIPYAALAALFYAVIGNVASPDFLHLALRAGAFALLLVPLFWAYTLTPAERSAIRRFGQRSGVT